MNLSSNIFYEYKNYRINSQRFNLFFYILQTVLLLFDSH